MNKLAIIAVAGLAAVATAEPLSAGNGSGGGNGAGVNLLDYATVTQTRDIGYSIVTITFNSDIPSWDLEGDLDNFVADLNFGVAGTIHGIGWDVTQTSVGASWGSEMVVSFADQGSAAGLYLTPSGTAAAITNENNASAGIVDLENAGIPDVVIASGVLSLEFFETFDDVADDIDGWWLEGSTITLDMFFVPAPGALALLGLGGLVSTRRRR